MAYSLPQKSLVLLALIVGLACLFWPARLLRSDTYVFYLADQRHIISSQAIGGTDYLPVLDLLNLAGKVANWEEKRNALRIRFGASLLELRLDKNRVKLNKTEVVKRSLDDGPGKIVLTSQRATLLAIAAGVLIVLAFALGLWIGSSW